ncbi:MAG: hypothetical protein HFJ43_04165 [Clostridia bacterium]|nr:hypothetical protein [Clostridia bacterium]
MQEIINEIRKLIEFASNGGTIKKEDIDKLSTKQMQAIIFDLTDNIGNKKIEKSLEILDTLIYNKEPHQKILITLYNHFKKLYLLKLHENLHSNIDVVQVLGLKPNQVFLVNKYKKQAMYFREEEIFNIINEFIDLDYKSKNGLMDIDVGIKAILCKNS